MIIAFSNILFTVLRIDGYFIDGLQSKNITLNRIYVCCDKTFTTNCNKNENLELDINSIHNQTRHLLLSIYTTMSNAIEQTERQFYQPDVYM